MTQRDRDDGGAGGMRALLRGNLLWLSVVSLLNDAASEMIYPLLPLFLTVVLGAGPMALGALEGVTESASSLLKLAGGKLADRTGRRKPLMVGGYALAALGRPLIAAATAAWHVLAIRFADRVGKGLRSAPRDALLAESVPAAHRGAAFGLHRAADHAGAVAGPLLASALLLAFPGQYRLVFALAIIPGIITVAVLVWKVREHAVSPPASPSSDDSAPASPSSPSRSAPTATDAAPAVTAASRTAAGDAISGDTTSGDTAADDARSGDARSGDAVSDDPISGDATSSPPGVSTADGDGRARVLRRYLVVLFLFTLGNASDAFLLLRAHELGVAAALVPLLWGVLHVSKMGWNVVGGRLGDRVGATRAIVAGWLVYAAVYAGFAVAAAEWHAWALFVVYGLFYGLTEGPEKALVAGLAPRERRGGAFGAYHMAIGLGALPASLAFGAVWQAFGAAAAFAMGGGLALVAAMALPLALRPHPAG